MSVPSRAAAPRDDAKGYLVVPIPPTAFGKYTIIGKLGHGGMAEVNLAVVGGKGGFRKLFVVKRLHAHLEAEPGFVDMFLDEARLAAQLDHPNCVQTVEVGEAEGLTTTGHRTAQHFLAMEFLDGQGLERLLRITGQRGDVLPIATSVRMIADALDGLGYAHDLKGYDGTPLGVVHRDVSPQNIFVTYAGVVKLLDFGIAKAESNVVETRTGVVKGKYAYIAPEQALAAPVDQRADLWSMGVVLWEMLTSRRLFKSVNELATLNETLRGDIHPPSKYNPLVPKELDAVVLGALQRDVEQRYKSATEFKEALERWLATQREQPDRKAIAALMKERFGEILEQHKERLKECIASVAQDPRSLDRLVLGASTSMEGDALQSGSHPPIPIASSGVVGTGGTGSRAIPAAPPSMTPTPSPRPRLGLSVSGSITSGMPSMDEIAPRAGATPSGSVRTPSPASSSSAMPSSASPAPPSASVAAPASQARASGSQGYPASTAQLSAPSSSSGIHPSAMSSSPGLATSGSTSAEWLAPSSPGFAAPPAGVSGAFGADQTTRMAPRRSRTRSFGWWLIGLAACVVSAVVAIVTWTAMHTGGAPTSELGTVLTVPPADPAAPLPTASTVVPGSAPGSMGAPAPAAIDPSAASTAPSLTTPDPLPASAPATERGPRRPRGGSRGERASSLATTTSTGPTPPPVLEVTPPAPPPPEPPARGQGFLSLRTSPWTNVTLDGRPLGETPLVRVALPAGTHTLRLRNPEQHIDETYEVTIRSGETTSQTLGLR